jgi:hypothetical protein
LDKEAFLVKKCNAMSKRSGAPCQSPAILGKEKCYNHGGRARSHKGRRAVIKSGLYGRFFTKEERDVAKEIKPKTLEDELTLFVIKIIRGQEYLKTLTEGTDEYWRTFEAIERLNARVARLKIDIIEQSSAENAEALSIII